MGKQLLLFLLVYTLCACESSDRENRLRVCVDETALRSAPGLKTGVLGPLHQGDVLIDLGEVSAFETTITYSGIKMQRPWIKVRDPNGREGWVFAGGLEPTAVDAARWLDKKRTDAYFGHALQLRLAAWSHSLTEARRAKEVAAAYRMGMLLRDTMELLLGRRTDPGAAPDENWLAALLPGFILQRSPDGGAPCFFADYHYWLQLAQSSAEGDDDAFVQCCMQVYPQDSIESPFPCWVFQIDEKNAASRLGSGQHSAIFNSIDLTRRKTDLFNPELDALKDALLEDILSKNTQYWLPNSAIVAELSSILAHPPECLNPAESSALERRSIMMTSPEKHGIVVDLRSGTAEPAE